MSTLVIVRKEKLKKQDKDLITRDTTIQIYTHTSYLIHEHN